MIALLENLLYDISNIFLVPVLAIIIAMFFYSFFQIGMFFMQAKNRKKYATDKSKGYPVYAIATKNNVKHSDDLEIVAFKMVEGSSMVAKIAPMLGLVATMIPMGPALKALANGNIQGISENLIVAFGAVILSLISASIAYWVTTVRKRWYATEIREYLARIEDEAVN